MSRTKKGTKPPGYEYWGKRPLSVVSPSKFVKTRTHRIERLKAKEEISEDLKKEEMLEDLKEEKKTS